MSDKTEDDLDTMPEAELLALPSQALPGWLSRLWAIRAIALHEREVNELALELAGDSGRPFMIFHDQDPKEKRRREEERRREQLEHELAMREIRDRQDSLLLRIEEEQREIDKRRKQIEDNALRLRDGRRVYVDGDRYRDGEGRANASTWEQKQETDRKAEVARRLKEKILSDREEGISPEEAGNRLTGYEKEFAQQAHERAAQAPVEFGSADYMADYGVPSAVPAFTQAADPAARETVRKPAGDEGTATAEMKKTPRPSGQGALKL
jgi:hypothetical protein